MIEDLTKMSRSQLDAELELYRGNPLEGMTVAEDSDLPNKDAAIAEIERLRKDFGYAHIVTEEDVAANPGIDADVLTVGEVVYWSQEEVDEETKKQAEAEIAVREKAAAEKKTADDKAAAGAPELPPEASKREPVPTDDTVASRPALNAETDDLVYKGKTVIRTSNKLVHGRRYIEVDCASETYTLTPEEFAEDVRPRNA